MSAALFIVFITLISAAICYRIAKKRGANPAFWIVLAAVIGPLAIPFVFLAKPKQTTRLEG